MNEIEITLAPPYKSFSIMTNIPHDQLEGCVVNWEVRHEDNLTAQSLIDYINSKTEMSGHKAEAVKEE